MRPVRKKSAVWYGMWSVISNRYQSPISTEAEYGTRKTNITAAAKTCSAGLW